MTQDSLHTDDGTALLEEIEEIRDLAETFMEVSARLSGVKEEVKEAKRRLIEAMGEHDLDQYSRGTVTVTVSPGNAKLRVAPRSATVPNADL